jgi:hypothetical protein
LMPRGTSMPSGSAGFAFSADDKKAQINQNESIIQLYPNVSNHPHR